MATKGMHAGTFGNTGMSSEPGEETIHPPRLCDGRDEGNLWLLPDVGVNQR